MQIHKVDKSKGRDDGTRMRFLDYARNDKADRSLDVARDDSGAVNSPSTTLKNDDLIRFLHVGRNDKVDGSK